MCPRTTGAHTPPSLPAGAYLERRCKRSRTPLLDSGTEGARGDVLPMVPPLTKPLQTPTGSTDGTFPLCTLRYYPNAIEHTLQVRPQVPAPALLFSLPVSPALQAGCSPSCFLRGAAAQPQRLPHVPAPSPAWPGPRPHRLSPLGTRCSSPVPSAQWARDEFEGLFQLPAESVNQFLE